MPEDPNAIAPKPAEVPPRPGEHMLVDWLAHREAANTVRMNSASASIGRIITWISLIAGAISFVIVGCVVFLAVMSVFKPESKIEIPQVLGNWGGIIIGFYFGQFANLVKDYLVVGGSPSGTAGTG
jgi:hypothetical protein